MFGIKDPSALLVGVFVFCQGILVIVNGNRTKREETGRAERKEAQERIDAEVRESAATGVRDEEREYGRLKDDYERLKSDMSRKIADCERAESLLKAKTTELDYRDAFLVELGCNFPEIQKLLSPPGTIRMLRERRSHLIDAQADLAETMGKAGGGP